jgi:hypothetical protein
MLTVFVVALALGCVGGLIYRQLQGYRRHHPNASWLADLYARHLVAETAAKSGHHAAQAPADRLRHKDAA